MIVRSDKHTGIEDVTGLLIIDWWQQHDDNRAWSSTVKQALDELQFLTVMVANYQIAPSLQDPVQFNTIQQYGWHDYRPSMLAPILKECGQQTTNQFVQDRYGDKSFLLLDLESILAHLLYTGSDRIKNWLVVGGGWGGCVHNRPVGLRNLTNIAYNFYITDWSIYHGTKSIINRQDIDQDSLVWLDHGDNLYQLSA